MLLYQYTAGQKAAVTILRSKNRVSKYRNAKIPQVNLPLCHIASLLKIMRVKIPRVIKPLNSLVLAIIVIIIKIIHFIISGVRWVHFDGPLASAMRTNRIGLKAD